MKYYISGSDVAIICGVGFLTPHELWQVKKGHSEIEKTESMEIGSELENSIRNLYKQRNKVRMFKLSEMDPSPSYPKFLGEGSIMVSRHKLGLEVKSHKYPYFIGHLDDYDLISHSVIEYKSTRDWITECPVKYILQTAFYCILTEASHGTIAVLHNTVDLSVFTYNRNEKLENYIIQKCTHFYDEHLAKDIPPEPTTLEDTVARNKRLYRNLDINPYIADENVSESILAYQELDSEIKEKSKLRDSMKVELLNKFQEHEFIKDEYGNDLATYKFNKSCAPGIDKKTLQQDFPEVWEKVKQERVPSRVFRVKKR